MSVTIEILDEAIPAVQRLGAALNSGERLNRAVSEAALPVFQGHFRGLASSNKNRFGTRGGFWNRMLSGTKAAATAEEAIVRMPREMALRYYGGTVTPKGGAKNLTIPARTEAYNKSARDFNDLRFVQFRSGAKALVQRDQTKISYRKNKRTGETKLVRGKEQGGMVFYWLVPSATIRGNKDVLPSEDQIIAGALKGLDAYLALVTRRSA